MSDPSSPAPRRRRRQAAPPPPQGSAARGIVLVVVAVLIGIALLRDDDASTAQVNVGAPDGSADVDDGDTSASSSTTTTAAPRTPADVKVLVANGSSVDGAAGAITDSLEALGYVAANPTNADAVPATVVYYTVGYQAEAEVLAAAIGAAPTSVTALPTPAPVDDMQLSNLLVVVGPDLAAAG